MFRELWGCGLCVCVCVFSGRVGPTGGSKNNPTGWFVESFSANSGPGGGGVPENQHKYEKVKITQTQLTNIWKQKKMVVRGDFLKKSMAQGLGVYWGFMQHKW